MDLIFIWASALGLLSTLGVGVALFCRQFYVHVDPDEHVVHYRNGHIKHLGRGISFFALPFDTWIKVPGTLRDVNFCADQVTRERQGVRVQGFLAYRIAVFEDAYQALDFKAASAKVLPPCSENVHQKGYEEKNQCRTVALDPADPLAKTDFVLRQLAESVIRHEVSNRTLDEMISERKKVIDSMRGKLLEVATGWGLSIETIEFTEVWIRSKEVFENLQAEYRNRIRLEAEESTFSTRREIELRRIESERRIAEIEAEAERSRRIKMAEEQAMASRSEIETRKQVQERQIEMERQIRDLERENTHQGALRELELGKQREIQSRQSALELQEEEHRVVLDRQEKEEEIKRREVEAHKARRLLALQAQVEVATRRAERERARGLAEQEREEAEARLREVQYRSQGAQVVSLAEAQRDAMVRESEGLCSRGEAEAVAIERRIAALNTVNARHIQRELVGEISRMAQHMKVGDVNWVNIAGDRNESPLGIIPRNILETLSIFKGLGVGLDEIMSGPAAGRGRPAGTGDGPAGEGE